MKQKTASLRGTIEKEVLNDSMSEAEVLDFTSAFLQDLSSIAPLEEFSLLTPEDASKAVEMLGKQKRIIEQRMRAAATLKKLLQRRSDGLQ